MKKRVMQRAWELARQGVKQFGGKTREYFAVSLRMAWAEIKEESKMNNNGNAEKAINYILSKLPEYANAPDKEKFEKAISIFAGKAQKIAKSEGKLFMTINGIDVCTETGGDTFQKFFHASLTDDKTEMDEFLKWHKTAIQDDYEINRKWQELHNAPETNDLEKQCREKLQMIVENSEAKAASYTLKIAVNRWENYGKKRVYFSVIETTEHSKHYAKYDFGYIDVLKNEYVAGKHNLNEKFNLSGCSF